MRNVVDKPIINDPFEEPTQHYAFGEGGPELVEGRRPAGYYYNPRTAARAGALAAEEFVGLDLANHIRTLVGEWRNAGYPSVTRVTRELLEYWNRPATERERRLFFCQREAAETVIWLVEVAGDRGRALGVPPDEPLEEGYRALTRYACKMATGSGKTVVMAMLVAWSVLNKVFNRQDRRFSDAVLIVCPNLTIKERLQVLLPSDDNNYYEHFDLVPRSYLEALGKGRYLVTNWHIFLRDDDTDKRGVVKRGRESDRAFVNRVLKGLGRKENILVVNDEAHHAYRPAPPPEDKQEKLPKMTAAERKEVEQEERTATVWVGGLDAINAERGVNHCLDFSATPYYLKGDRREGKPLPWVVSDFGLVDAIESGLVKIPRIPVADDSGDPIPRYFHVWPWIMERLHASERRTRARGAKPEAVLREVEGALATLASSWKELFEKWRKDEFPVPPALIVVCDNTKLSEAIAEHIKSGKILAELADEDGYQPTVRIDTRLLDEAEKVVEGESRQDRAERLRKVVSTVGKVGEPGEQVRCVVSVGMLNEGWDAHNVTHILGIRAFASQLLCEQVVGRGLRRTNYDEVGDPDAVEYVDVYGIPFQVIPVAGGRGDVKPPPPSTLVRALPDRANLTIEFPRVEGYIYDVRRFVKADVNALPELVVEPSREPTEVIVTGVAGTREGSAGLLSPGTSGDHDRDEFHEAQRLQRTLFEIAAAITANLSEETRRFLFPQVLRIVEEYVAKKVRVKGDVPLEELALRRYSQDVIDRLCAAIEPDTEAGETPVLPRIERFRPRGSTGEVMFRTVRPCAETAKSHVSHVVLDNVKWERSAAFKLERMPEVVSYVKNEGLDFYIPYEYQGVTHNYKPDFVIRYRHGDEEISVVMEVKGFETEQDRAKETGARRWERAINHHGGFGRWRFVVCRDPATLAKILEMTPES